MPAVAIASRSQPGPNDHHTSHHHRGPIQNMIGKIAGPLYGALLYESFGRNVFVIGVLAVNLVAAGCAEITMPPSKSSRAEEKKKRPAAKPGEEDASPLLPK